MSILPRRLLIVAFSAAALAAAGSLHAAGGLGRAVGLNQGVDRAAMAPPARLLSVADWDRAPFPGFILARAEANYRALMNGSKRLEDLNGIERREVAELQRRIRAKKINRRSSREQCIAEQTAARGGNVTDLAARIIDLACSQR